MSSSINIFWFRRDLRLTDNTGLFHALRSGLPVVPVFIFDENILRELDRSDVRISFIYNCLMDLQKALVQCDSTMDVRYGKPEVIFTHLLQDYAVDTVYTNHDYEPYALKRDQSLKRFFESRGVGFKTFKDQVIFEKDEVTKDDGSEYKVFTPYSKKWKQNLSDADYVSNDVKKYMHAFLRQSPKELPNPESMGFKTTSFDFPRLPVKKSLISDYHHTRDIPSVSGTTRLGVHLRFGTVSIRSIVKQALQLNSTFLGELIWREFFMQLLWRHPEVTAKAYKQDYDHIRWNNHTADFEKWCNGETGYPIVDAGMRELNETGFMHNRVRMITASFLVKHLLIDWRWGEAYFADKLLDFELSSNNGNWQWVAGCGCDAAPYFRIFNPLAQTKRFDPQYLYIKKWVPEYNTPAYPKPVIDHEYARERCLKAYKTALREARSA